MASWLDNLEARLEQSLEAFLRANPEQEALLAQQNRQDQERQRQQQRLALRAEAEQRRQQLLALAAEIQRWQERVEQAERAGAGELAGRARRRRDELMDEGRLHWETLARLGEQLQRLEAPEAAMDRGASAAATPGAAGPVPAKGMPADNLEDDWRRFETQQELERLRRDQDQQR